MFDYHSMFRGCSLLILFAYIWPRAFKKKNQFSVRVKNIHVNVLSKSGDHEYSDSFPFLNSTSDEFTLQWEMGVR